MRARNVALVSAVLLAVALQAGADVITLEDQNAIAKFDPASSNGMYSWTIDGVEHLYQQWFWYRIGSAGAEMPLNNLLLNATTPVDTNGDGDYDFLILQYKGSGLQVDLKFILTGADLGSHTADMAETITIKNTSAASIALHFYQFCDLDLNNTPYNDTVEIRDGARAFQSDPLGGWASETVATAITGPPSHHEAGDAGSILAKLTDASPTDLSDATGPFTGDAAWSFQWDFNLGSGKSVLISKDKLIVPEPAAMSLLAVGGLALIVRRRRK